MQIPQVSAQPHRDVAEQNAVDGDKPSTKPEAGEQGVFAQLLALLQGAATPAQTAGVNVEAVVEGTESGEPVDPANSAKNLPLAITTQDPSSQANSAKTEGNAAVAKAIPLEVPPPVQGETPDSVDDVKLVPPPSPEKAAPAESSEARAPAIVVAKGHRTVPVVITEVHTNVKPETTTQTSSAAYVVPVDTDTAEEAVAVKPADAQAQATAPPARAASEAAIPIAKAAVDDATEHGAAQQPVAPPDESETTKTESSRSSTARFVVAKPASTRPDAPAAKVQPAPQAPNGPAAASTQSPNPGDSDTTPVQESLNAEAAVTRKSGVRDSADTTSTDATRIEGAKPAVVHTQTAASLHGEHRAPANGTESVKPQPDQAPPPERATLKTVVVDTVKGVRYLLTKGEQTMRIRLVPESLGELKLVVTSNNDGITVRLASASHAVREMLHTQVHHLREALSQDGGNVGKITVTADMSAGAGPGNPQTGSPDRAWTPNQRGWTGGHAPSPRHQPTTTGQQPVAVPRRTAPYSGALNLFA